MMMSRSKPCTTFANARGAIFGIVASATVVSMMALFPGREPRIASAQDQDSQTPGIPEDDPFADELNPFGSGKGAKTAPPAAAPRPPAAAPKMQLPMPFPERTLPGAPAARRPSPEPPMPRPEPARPAQPALRGRTPFPEAEE
jgi:hypothetical protein